MPRWIALLLCVLLLGSVQAQGALYDLPSANTPVYSSNTLAYTRLGRLIIANPLAGTASIFRPVQQQLDAEIRVGANPSSVSVTADSNRALVLSRGDGLLAVLDLNTESLSAVYRVGVLPAHVLTDNDTTAYVTRHGTHDVVEVDLASGQVVQRIPTPPYPHAMAIWGDFLYITHLYSGDVSLIYRPTAQVVRTVSTGAGLAYSITLDARNARAYLPQSIVNAGRPGLPLDARFMPVVTLLDLASLQVLPTERIWLPLADRQVHLPYAATLNSQRTQLYVAHAGSNAVSVIDLRSKRAIAHVPVGANPRAIVFSRDNRTLYTHDAVDQTLSLIDTFFFMVDDQLPLSQQALSPQQALGARHFHTATDPRLSATPAASCAACHADGLSDGQVWDERNTPVLWGAAIDPDALNHHMQQVQGGTGLGFGGLDAAALRSYLNSLSIPPNPLPQAEDAQRGALVFDVLACSECHQGPAGSDGLLHDVGTGGDRRTPTLRHLWQSAPYLHDGSRETLRAVFTRGQGTHRLPTTVLERDIEALLAYLLRWQDAP